MPSRTAARRNKSMTSGASQRRHPLTRVPGTNKVIIPQFDGRAMRRPRCSVIPSVVITSERRRIAQSLLGNHALERCEPVLVIGLARIRVTGGLGALDLLTEG